MDFEWKHTQRSLEFSRCFVGPDRAEIAKWSNDVGPHVDNAIHGFAPFSRPKAHIPMGEGARSSSSLRIRVVHFRPLVVKKSLL
jgi:hypothetical protein